MKELSIFVDESGSDDLACAHYLVALLLHDQDDHIAESISKYENSLVASGLPDIPFHAEPLMNGHGRYSGLSLETRARLFTSFRVFFRHLPIRYALLAFKTKEYESLDELTVAMKKTLIDLLFNQLGYLQLFDRVKIYYDGGQASITSALKGAVRYALSKEAVVYRPVAASDYRLYQASDYICALEAAVIRFNERRASATDEKFYGGWSRFKKGPLKELRRKCL